jgi:hypothetical protein
MLGTAYHEAGHAVVAHMLGYRLLGISIDSDVEGKLGHSGSDVLPESLKQSKNWRQDVVTPEEWTAASDDIVIHLAGATAEELLQGREYVMDPDDPRSSDETEVIGRLVRMCGTNCDAQNNLLADSLVRGRVIVKDHWEKIDDVAKALLEQRTLSGPETEELIDRSHPSG